MRIPERQDLSESAIFSSLEESVIKVLTKLLLLELVDSTNSYLLNYSRATPLTQMDMLVCATDQQNNGRGRRGRSWISPPGYNIYLSTAHQFSVDPTQLSGLSLAVAVAIVRVLSAYDLPELSIKWPNDVYCNGKKLAGVLVDVVCRKDQDVTVVIGIGLNRYIDQSAANQIDQQWTDLSALLQDRLPVRNELLALLINAIAHMIAEFRQSGFAAFQPEWNNYDYLRDKAVTLLVAEQEISGVCIGVNAQGLLLLNNNQGEQCAYAAGETIVQKKTP
jgi:BirA family biotin operon repressor/biotin-[acetyl-CoA-carboxylase] ligase